MTAKALMVPLADSVERELAFLLFLGMSISRDAASVTDKADSSISGRSVGGCFWGGRNRSRKNGQTHVLLHAPDEDVIFVFTHILHCNYQEGIGM